MFNSQEMDVCCLKMASRCRPPRHVMVDGSRLPALGSSHHDCGSLEQVVMVRKRDQRIINHHHSSGDTQSETVTYETIQTYRGHKPQRTCVLRETSRDEFSNNNPEATQFADSHEKILSQITSGVETMGISGSSSLMASQSSSGSSMSSVPDSITLDSHLNAVQSNSFSVSPSAVKKKVSNSPLRKISPAGRTDQGSAFTAFELECLRAHNEYRTKHGVPPLKLNKKLCKYAEEWALTISRRGTLQHRDRSPYGENIFCSWSSQHGTNITIDGREPVKEWYKESSNHIFGKEPSTLKTGHFTQVVWLDSRELGVGVARNRNGRIYVVANYDPPGNFIGSFTSNVPPIGGFQDAVDGAKFVSELDVEWVAFSTAVLKHHNDYRRLHNAERLTLDNELTKGAQTWATILADENRFGHNPQSRFGENLYCLWSSDRNAKADPKEVCKSWYEEVKEFEFGIEPKGLIKAAHFTQLVWKSSKKLGVGMAKTKSGKVIVVCTYEPRGNIIGQYNANVLRQRRF